MSPAPQRSHEEKMVLLLQLICDNEGWHSRGDLAKSLGYKYAATVAKALRDLASMEFITRRSVPLPNGQKRYDYIATDLGCYKLAELKGAGFL